MTDRLDEQIALLVAELIESAPQAPPFPDRDAVPAPRPVPVWVPRLAAAAAVLVLVVGGGIGLLTLADLGGADEAAMATTTAPAATLAPTTTTAAATTTVAAETTTTAAPATTVPIGGEIDAVLSAQCFVFAENAAPLFAEEFTTSDQYEEALEVLEKELLALLDVVGEIPAREAEARESLTVLILQSLALVDEAGQAGIGNAAEHLNGLQANLSELAAELVEFGALDCARLAEVIP